MPAIPTLTNKEIVVPFGPMYHFGTTFFILQFCSRNGKEVPCTTLVPVLSVPETSMLLSTDFYELFRNYIWYMFCKKKKTFKSRFVGLY